MLMAEVELRFTPRPEHARTARLIAAAVGRRSGVPDVLVDEVKLAAGEACARAVNVHRRKAPGEPVVVRLTGLPDCFMIQVLDCGPPGEEPTRNRDPIDSDSDSDSDSSDGLYHEESDDGLLPPLPDGLGLAILEGLVDDVEILPREDALGTVVTMRWHLTQHHNKHPGKSTS
jgi:serine/threonine-protein kinase RsbW